MGNLQAAIDEAQRMTWDQSIGYTFGGDGNPDSNGYDCSAFVIRSLYRAGYNVPAHRVGTAYMKPVLQGAGFTIIPCTTTQNPPVESGDILVYTHYTDLAHTDPDAGHTYFYVENIQAYTDANADSDNVGLVARAKVEASTSHGASPGSGDSRKNGTGAYWQVWSHAFNGPIIPTSYDVTSPYVDAYIARDPNGLTPMPKLLGALLAMLFLPRNRKRRFL